MLFVPPSMPFMVPEAEAADTTPPVITVPSDQTFTEVSHLSSATDTGGYVYTYQVSATDNIGIVYFDCDSSYPPMDNQMGTSVHGSASWDPIPPPWTGTAYKIYRWYDFSGSATMNSENPHVHFPVGSTLISCEVQDAAGNTETASFTVTVNGSDITPPVVTVPDNMTVSAISPSVKIFVTFSVAAVDAVEGVHYADCVPSGTTAGGYGVGSTDGWDWEDTLSLGNPTTFTVLFPIGTTTVFCNATDNTGNEGTASFTVTVLAAEDETPPQLWLMSSNMSGSSYAGTTFTRTALNSTGYNFYWLPQASDDVSTYDSGIVISCTVNGVTVPSFSTSPFDGVYQDSNSWVGSSSGLQWMHNHLFPIGTNQVICTAYDAAGNTSSESFVVNVLEPPGGSDTTQLTINSLEIIQFSGQMTWWGEEITVPNQYRWEVSGDAPPLTHITYGFIKPDGYVLSTGSGNSSVTGTYSHSQSSPLNEYTNSGTAASVVAVRMSGVWTFQACITSSGICVEQNFTITAPSEEPEPPEFAGTPVSTSITVTAYVNATSPTGRTLNIAGSDIFDPTVSSLYATISKDGTALWEPINLGLTYSSWSHPPYQRSIPEDWASGTYDITWVFNYTPAGWYTLSGSDSSTVTIPALPSGDTTPPTGSPTVTATAYLNGTSPTGRTLSLNGDDLDPGVDYFSNRDGYEYLKFNASISKDNTTVLPFLSFYEWLLPLSSDCLDPGVTGSGDYSNALAAGYYHCADGWQIPIPTDWDPGTYVIAWETDLFYEPSDPCWNSQGNRMYQYAGCPEWTPDEIQAFQVNQSHRHPQHTGQYLVLFAPSSSTTVTIPALPGTAEAAAEAAEAAAAEAAAAAAIAALEAEQAAEAAVEEEIVIPSWIKSNAGWWDAGLIDDRNYVTGLQWLITNGIMTIPPTEQGTGSDDVIPSWVKNNARWWADGSIDDRNYVTGLQWLITNGVMTIG